ncbi:Helix-turn-helix type 11 domain-containing protein, partial [Dysosmobacter welbionis]
LSVKCFPICPPRRLRQNRGVDHGGFGVLMPQELLNHRQRHPTLQRLRSKGMPQDMGVDPPFQPGPLPDSCQGFLNASRRQRAPWRSDRREERVSALPLTQVFPQKLSG